MSYANQNRHEQAEPLFLEALSGYRQVLGPEHKLTLSTVRNLIKMYRNQGRFEEAVPLARELVSAAREGHPGYDSSRKLLDSILARLEDGDG